MGLQIGWAKHRLIKKKKNNQAQSEYVGEKALFFFSLIFCKKSLYMDSCEIQSCKNEL